MVETIAVSVIVIMQAMVWDFSYVSIFISLDKSLSLWTKWALCNIQILGQMQNQTMSDDKSNKEQDRAAIILSYNVKCEL